MWRVDSFVIDKGEWILQVIFGAFIIETELLQKMATVPKDFPGMFHNFYLALSYVFHICLIIFPF